MDAKDVFWTVAPAGSNGQFSGTGRLYKVAKDGASPPTIVEDGIPQPLGLAIDATFLYWGEGTFQGANGRIMRTLKP